MLLPRSSSSSSSSSSSLSSSSSSSSSRLYDLCIYGASGFTGRLASLYLAKSYPTSLRFSIAGRDETKLKQLEAELKVLRSSTAPSIGVIVCSGDDMTTVAQSSKVVVSTAGPFLRFGEALVKACVKTGTHYCNISGEPLFFKSMEEKYGQEAKENGVVLCMMSGFDSIPADLCTYLAAKKAKTEFGVCIESAKAYISMRGSASGGTIATFFNSMKHPQQYRELDPLFLNIKTKSDSSDSVDSVAISQDSVAISQDSVTFPHTSDFATGFINVPFIMAPINTRIVRRSASAFASNTICRYTPSTKQFTYSEVGLRSLPLWKVWLSYLMDTLQFFLLKWLPGFALFAQNNLVLKPGFGPKVEDIITKNYFHYLVAAKTFETIPRRVIVRMTGGDGGYADTAVMLVESGLCLALEFEKCKTHQTLSCLYGFHTPATALGEILVDRLNVTKRVKFEYIKDTPLAISKALEPKRAFGLEVAEVGKSL
jgi:short subunit dehydrogenase-like uncharacterized protein